MGSNSGESEQRKRNGLAPAGSRMQRWPTVHHWLKPPPAEARWASAVTILSPLGGTYQPPGLEQRLYRSARAPHGRRSGRAAGNRALIFRGWLSASTARYPNPSLRQEGRFQN